MDALHMSLLDGGLSEHVIQQPRGEATVYDADVTIESVTDLDESRDPRLTSTRRHRLVGPLPEAHPPDGPIASERLPQKVLVCAFTNEGAELLVHVTLAVSADATPHRRPHIIEAAAHPLLKHRRRVATATVGCSFRSSSLTRRALAPGGDACAPNSQSEPSTVVRDHRAETPQRRPPQHGLRERARLERLLVVRAIFDNLTTWLCCRGSWMQIQFHLLLQSPAALTAA